MKATRRLVLSIVLVGVVVSLSVAGFLTGTRPQLGLDLVGGISVVLQGPPGTTADVMQRAAEDIRSRIDALGVAEPQISVVGSHEIEVQVAGLAHGHTTLQANGKWCASTASGENLGCNFDSKQAADLDIQSVGQQRLLDLIGKTARLEERVVLNNTPYVSGQTHLTACSPDFVSQEPFKTDCNNPSLVKCPVNGSNLLGCSNEALADKTVTLLGRDVRNPSTIDAFTMGPVEITGDAISGARAVFQTASSGNLNVTQQGWQITFTLTGSGSKRFGIVTQQNIGKELAIVLDRDVESYPTVQSAILNGSGVITGNFTEQEAKDIALVLNVGSLPVELTKQNVETVSPTLGKQSLHQGLIAGLAGLIALMLYLAFYYRLLGIVTWFGMTIWAILALALVSVMGKTVGYALSLAGIAGIVVSMGITADSYIVFYERLKDEVRQGKTLRTAVVPAFKRAWHTIVAADIVTILAAAILYLLSIGSVRGFALTLGLATALDMFVVYFFKRPTVFLLSRNPAVSNLRGFGLRSGVAADPLPAVAGGSE